MPTDTQQSERPAGLAPTAGSATLPDWHRLSIRYDGTEIIGVTVTCKRPENHEQMTALIRDLLDCMNAPTVPDPEVLGDKSPNAELCYRDEPVDARKTQQR